MKNYTLNKRIGFTLAEVLITLGIIGVVAAMTIPTLISNYNKNLTITRLKKAYGVVTNAYKLSMIDNGAAVLAGSGNGMTAEQYVRTYYLPYFSGAKLCTTYQDCGFESATPYKDEFNAAWGFIPVDASRRIPFITTDGMIYWFAVAQGTDTEGNPIPASTVYIDINGAQKPNRVCADMFVFRRTTDGIIGMVDENDPDDTSCVAEIINNGWEFPDDYPVEF